MYSIRTEIERLINGFAIMILILLSVIVLTYQFMLNQPPCPLCMLLHIGYLFMAFGFLLNLRFGLRSSHYAIILLSALFTNFIALRETALRPRTDYQSASLFFGLHLSTWSVVISLLIVIATTILLGFKRNPEELHGEQTYWKTITHSLFAILALIILLNIIYLASTYFIYH